MTTAQMEDFVTHQQPPPPPWQPAPGFATPATWQPRSKPPRPPRKPPSWPATVWPLRRRSAASPHALLAAAVAGIVAAVTLRINVIGIGYPITGAGLLVAALGFSGARPSRAQLVTAAGSCALLDVAAVRSAAWLVTLCVLLGLIVGSLSLVRVRTWAGLAVGSVVMLLVPLRAARWAVRGLARLRVGGGSPVRTAIVLGVTAVLVVTFGALFASADPAYANVLNAVVPYRNAGSAVGRVVAFAFVTAIALAATYTARRPPLLDVLAPAPATPLRRWEWAAPLVILDVLFASFVAVQLTVLFGGRRHVLSTAGLTYAQYARQGFWQLLAVTALTLAVVAVAVRKAARASQPDKTIVRALLGTLCILALVIVASAIHRMSTYEQAYGFTRLRVFVTGTEFWLGAVLILVLIAGIRMSGSWLPQAVLASAVVAMLTLAAINPDAYIARHDVARYYRTGQLDPAYLATLSADAYPALARLPAALRACTLQDLAPALRATTPDPWYEFNLDRSRARSGLTNHPVPPCQLPSTGGD
jgi:hypothetical protein